MKSENWTTEKGTKIEMDWEVKVYDLSVVKEIVVLVNGKKYVSDGELRNGNLYLKQYNNSNEDGAQLPVAQNILDEIDAAYKAGKLSIAKNVEEHNDHLRRMAQLGY